MQVKKGETILGSSVLGTGFCSRYHAWLENGFMSTWVLLTLENGNHEYMSSTYIGYCYCYCYCLSFSTCHCHRHSLAWRFSKLQPAQTSRRASLGASGRPDRSAWIWNWTVYPTPPPLVTSLAGWLLYIFKLQPDSILASKPSLCFSIRHWLCFSLFQHNSNVLSVI